MVSHGPQDAKLNLADIRSAIDALDENIVELLAEREKLVRRAAGLKSSVAEVAAPDRAEQVIRRAAELASARGADSSVTTAIFSVIVQSFISLELRACNTHS